jgi:hypothetical protein
MIGAFVLATFVFAGEAIPFDVSLRPQFTRNQLSRTSSITRAGLAKWAATQQGHRLIDRFRTPEYVITVSEDRDEGSPGRAPQPGMATFLATSDPTKIKYYTLIVNPAVAEEYRMSDTISLDLGEPRTPDDVMAAAWAGEMLHIDFYANGVPLPHHNRSEFQKRWRQVAFELGFPRMRHDTEEP